MTHQALAGYRGVAKAAALAVILISVSGLCSAGQIAFNFSSSSPGTSICCGTYGFQFTPLVNIFVDSLGYLDVGQNGLAASHEVGIWNSSGTLLLSQSLSTGTLEGPVLDGAQFTYTPTPDFLLLAGQTYTIGGEEDASDNIFYDFSGTQTSNIPSLLTVSSSGYYVVGAGFADPTSTIGNHYDIVNFTAVVAPEPSSVGLTALGLIGMIGAIRRRRRLEKC